MDERIIILVTIAITSTIKEPVVSLITIVIVICYDVDGESCFLLEASDRQREQWLTVPMQ